METNLHQLRLCVNCEFKRGVFCSHPELKRIDLVDGHHSDQSCTSLRCTGGRCGKEGKYYNPKEAA